MFFKHNLGEKSTTWQTTENIIKPVLVIAWVWPSSPQSSWCRAGSMNALADKVHKQEVPCTQWYWYARHTMATLFINHPYISIAVAHQLTLNFITATYVGTHYGLWIMWPWYGVHTNITVCMELLVCVLCQPVHSLSQPYIHQLDFCLEISAIAVLSPLIDTV